MTGIRFTALPTETVRGYRTGGPDAHGRAPEKYISKDDGAPCRHCLREIEKDVSFLILAHTPFSTVQAYAETGPIFLHGEACERYPETDKVPEMFLKRERMLIRGYDRNDRIVYGTGCILGTGEIVQKSVELLARPEIAYCHLRSGLYNCYQCRIDRT